MTIDKKIAVLSRVYELHDRFINDQDQVCKKYCSICCTVNATLSTVEGINIINYLKENGQLDKLEILKKMPEGKRYQPEITTNKFAELCLNRQDIPEEENFPDWGKCPFLLNDTCTIYPARPLGCRSMISKTKCSASQYAEIDEFIVTINTVFLQFIEHMDIPGFSFCIK